MGQQSQSSGLFHKDKPHDHAQRFGFQRFLGFILRAGLLCDTYTFVGGMEVS